MVTDKQNIKPKSSFPNSLNLDFQRCDSMLGVATHRFDVTDYNFHDDDVLPLIEVGEKYREMYYVVNDVLDDLEMIDRPFSLSFELSTQIMETVFEGTCVHRSFNAFGYDWEHYQDCWTMDNWFEEYNRMHRIFELVSLET